MQGSTVAQEVVLVTCEVLALGVDLTLGFAELRSILIDGSLVGLQLRPVRTDSARIPCRFVLEELLQFLVARLFRGLELGRIRVARGAIRGQHLTICLDVVLVGGNILSDSVQILSILR
jgi:hypothetical protein